MRFEPQQFDEERSATALRAFFVTLLFSLIALWAFGGTSVPARSQVGIDRQPFEQGAKPAVAANQRTLAAKLERAKPWALPGLDLSSPVALADSLAAAAPALLEMAPWTSDAVCGACDKAHHYAATGPPGRQLS